MSHTTSINEVVFRDIDALKAAVLELNKSGVKCSLSKGGTPRAYSANQEGLGKADYVLRLDNSPYDVGFYMNKESGGLEARTDFFAGHIAKQLGIQNPDHVQKGESQGQRAMGRLFQMYQVHAATRQAIKQGYRVQRQTTANGAIKLVVSGMPN